MARGQVMADTAIQHPAWIPNWAIHPGAVLQEHLEARVSRRRNLRGWRGSSLNSSAPSSRTWSDHGPNRDQAGTGTRVEGLYLDWHSSQMGSLQSPQRRHAHFRTGRMALSVSDQGAPRKRGPSKHEGHRRSDGGLTQVLRDWPAANLCCESQRAGYPPSSEQDT